MTPEAIAAVEANTAAVQALTDITTRLYDLRSSSIEEIKAAAAGAKAPAKGKKADETPAADKKADETPAADAAASAPAADAAVNRLAEVQKICASYAGGSDRPEEREARKEKLTWLFGKVGAKKLAEIPAGREAAVIKAVTQLIADGDLTSAEPEAPAAVEEDDLLAT